jgi:hypothetical protein
MPRRGDQRARSHGFEDGVHGRIGVQRTNHPPFWLGVKAFSQLALGGHDDRVRRAAWCFPLCTLGRRIVNVQAPF